MNIIIAGDFCPFDGFSFGVSEKVRCLFADADYSFVNLECPLTNSDKQIYKVGPNLKASPKQIETLNALGVNCVTLANNHIQDYGGRGVVDTMKLCDNHGIRTVGAGCNIKEARIPLIIEKDGIRIAIINVAEREFNIATDNGAGANPFDIINLLNDIEQARKVVNKIVVVIHGGLEYVPFPSPDSVRMLRFIAKQQNVIAVVRHHPHVIQSMEVYDGVPIYYSLGNLYFPTVEEKNGGWFNGLIVKLEIKRDSVEFSHMTVAICRKKKYDFELIEKVMDLPHYCLDEIAGIWEREIVNRRMFYFDNLFFPWELLSRISRRLRLLNGAPPTKLKKAIAMNLIRCDAHREMILEALKA